MPCSSLSAEKAHRDLTATQIFGRSGEASEDLKLAHGIDGPYEQPHTCGFDTCGILPPKPIIANVRSRSAKNNSGIARRVGLAENVDGIAWYKRMAGQAVVGKQREIGDREQTDAVEDPDRKTFHPAIVPREDAVRERLFQTFLPRRLTWKRRG
jgi:hypothetical protein